jgi:Glycosyltransferase family 87
MAVPPRRRWIWTLVFVLIAIAIAGRAASRKPTRGVLLDHLEFGRRLLHGEDVHGPWRSDPDAPIRPLHAPYPPSFGLLTAPFHLVDAALGQRAARLGWALLQLACLVALAFALRELLRRRAAVPDAAADANDARRWPWLWLGTLLLGLRFVLRDTHGGGGNIINTALAVVAFLAAERQRPRTAGALLAFSLVTKPTLVWLLPVFWLFGHRRAVLATALAAAAMVLATMALQRFELVTWSRWLQGSLALLRQSDAWAVPAYEFPPFEWMNQALRFAVARWCGTVPAEFAAKVPGGIAAGLGLAPEVVVWLTRTASVTLLGGVVWTAWRTRAVPSARLWTTASALALTLLLSPLSWKGHHVALLPVLLLLLHDAVQWRRTSSAVVLLLWFVPCSLPGGDLVGDAFDEWLNSTYVVTFGDVALLAVALWRAHRSVVGHGTR